MTRISPRQAIVAVAVILSVAALAAQQRQLDNAIAIGGVEVSLGMAQDDALTPLSHLYDVRHQDNMPGLWTVFRKGGPPYEIIGTLNFGGGRLVSATKTWGPFKDSQTAEGHAAALFDAVNAVTNGATKSCTIVADSRPQVRSVQVTCGRRTLTAYSPPNNEFAATVDERIHK